MRSRRTYDIIRQARPPIVGEYRKKGEVQLSRTGKIEQQVCATKIFETVSLMDLNGVRINFANDDTTVVQHACRGYIHFQFSSGN